MSNRKEMIDFAISRMAGLTLEESSVGDNRSVFSLIKSLILSVSGETLAECRKPLASVLGIRVRDQRDKFHGIKLTLLHKTIRTLFGDSTYLISEKEFAGYNRDKLLDYLEICRRIYIAQYPSVVPIAVKAVNKSSSEPKFENAVEKAFRLARERSERRTI